MGKQLPTFEGMRHLHLQEFMTSQLTTLEPFIVDWYPFVGLTYIQYEINKY